jgi:threonine dehydrogenase-like Zn-dependent dehydrogenase
MKAVNYQGAFKVKVEDVPKPSIEHPDDVVVKVTTAGTSSPRPRQGLRCEP